MSFVCTQKLLPSGGAMKPVAMATGFIAPPDGNNFWVQTNDILADPQVQDYYVKFYPLKLPQLLRFRLKGVYQGVVDRADMLVRPVMQFVALDQRFMETLNKGCLLRMLDAFTIG